MELDVVERVVPQRLGEVDGSVEDAGMVLEYRPTSPYRFPKPLACCRRESSSSRAFSMPPAASTKVLALKVAVTPLNVRTWTLSTAPPQAFDWIR